MASKKLYRKRALFLITLILTLPFYSAAALADVTVIKNTGKANVPGFIDAAGDTWTVEVSALIPGQAVGQNQIKVNGFPFDTCVPAAANAHNCRYAFNFERSPIFETTYPLDIQLFKQGEDQPFNRINTVVVADGSAPQITNVHIRQSGPEVLVIVVIDEAPDACVGLHKLEFFDATTGTKLKTLEGATLESQAGSICGQNTISETVAIGGAVTAPKTVRVVAFDRLNHSVSVNSNSIVFDRVTPNILENTFKVGDFSRFVPSGTLTAPVSIQVVEDQNLLFASATSAALSMQNEQVTCTKTNHANNTFTCVWPSRQVNVAQSVSAVITASDGSNNQTKTVSVSFEVDSTAPVVDSFGTVHTFNGVNFARRAANNFTARFTEAQSGLNASNVLANFAEINRALGTRRPADSCTEVSAGQWTCVWANINANNPGTVFLVEARDNVGNRATALPGAAVELDVTPPVIGAIDIVALAGTTGEARTEVFQSRDVLRVTFDVTEANGVSGSADISDTVSNGGIVPASCTLKAGTSNTFTCTLTTPEIKSGFDPEASIKIIAEDTAGNKADATARFEILGTDVDTTNPDFWSKGKVTCSPNGLDVNTLKLASQRVFCSVPFKTGADVRMLGSSLVGCTGPTDKLSRSFLINNFADSTTPLLVFEFVPFEEQIDKLEFECTLRLRTIRGNLVIQQPEEESVNVTVPFFVTPFDKELSEIEDEIDDAKDEVESGFFGVIGILNTIVKYAKLICQTLALLDKLRIIWNNMNFSMETLRSNPLTIATAIATCETAEQVGSSTEYLGFEPLKIFCDVVSCKKSTLSIFSDTADGWWSTNVIGNYQAVGTLGLGTPADRQQAFKAVTDPYDSLPSALVNLCLPAIVYNLDKLRQIECRYISCLENEVKSGVATIESCREMQDFLECKYMWGNIFQALPFVSLIDGILNKVKAILSDPIGLLRLVSTLLCGNLCIATNTGTVACNVVSWLFAAADLYQDIAAILKGFKTINQDYCSQVL